MKMTRLFSALVLFVALLTFGCGGAPADETPAAAAGPEQQPITSEDFEEGEPSNMTQGEAGEEEADEEDEDGEEAPAEG